MGAFASGTGYSQRLASPLPRKRRRIAPPWPLDSTVPMPPSAHRAERPAAVSEGKTGLKPCDDSLGSSVHELGAIKSLDQQSRHLVFRQSLPKRPIFKLCSRDEDL